MRPAVLTLCALASISTSHVTGFVHCGRRHARSRSRALSAAPEDVDAAMFATYDVLAAKAVEEAQALPDGSQWWCAIAGGPAAGKSTLAAAVAQRCNALGVSAVVLPMDGFHYSRYT